MNRLSADLSVVDLYLFMKAESRCECIELLKKSPYINVS